MTALRQAVGVPTEEAAPEPDVAVPTMRVPDFGEDPKYDFPSLDDLIGAANQALKRLKSPRAGESLPADKALVGSHRATSQGR